MLRRFSTVFIVLVLAFGIWYFLTPNKYQVKKEKKAPVQVVKNPEAKLYFQFKKVEEKWLARSGSIEVMPEQVWDGPLMKSIAEQNNELFIALLLYSHISFASQAPKAVILHRPKMPRGLDSIANQFGMPLSSFTRWTFQDTEKKDLIATIDGKKIYLKDLDQKHYLWGAIQTRTHLGVLQEVDRIIKSERVVKEAFDQKMNVQDYIAKYIEKPVLSKITPKQVAKIQKEKKLPQDAAGKKQAVEILKKSLVKKSYDYFLEKFLLDLPILVNWTPPYFDPKLSSEYVPFFGDPNSEVVLSIFSDSVNPNSQKLLSEIRKLKKEFIGMKVEYRPVIAEGSSFQSLREKFNACVWQLYPDDFWTFLEKTQNQYGHKEEEEMLKVLTEMGRESASVLACTKQPQTSDIVEYHKKYSDYLGIKGGPIAFVAGQVLLPPIKMQDIKIIINRLIQNPDAATW